MPPLLTLAIFGVWLSALLGRLGNLASYHRWRGDRPGELLRVGSGLSGVGFLALLLAHFVLTGQWGWFWWTVIVLMGTILVMAALRSTNSYDGPHSEDGSRAGRNPSD
jgi:peptidoglycan/LPS O-acetylase OafA/YrhL